MVVLGWEKCEGSLAGHQSICNGVCSARPWYGVWTLAYTDGNEYSRDVDTEARRTTDTGLVWILW